MVIGSIIVACGDSGCVLKAVTQGDVEEVVKVAKQYRVYYSRNTTGPEGGDYLIDHSIITYLIDPNGRFVTFFGKNSTSDDLVARIAREVRKGPSSA